MEHNNQLYFGLALLIAGAIMATSFSYIILILGVAVLVVGIVISLSCLTQKKEELTDSSDAGDEGKGK